MDGELLQPRTQHSQFRLRLPQGSVESKLISPIQRPKVKGFHRLIKLLITLAFVLRVSVNDRSCGKDFLPQQPGIRTGGGRLDQQLRSPERALHAVHIDADCHQKFLAWLGVLRQNHRLLHVLVGSLDH